MQREQVVAGMLVMVVLATVVAALVVPGIIAAPGGGERPGRVGVEEVTIATDAVQGATVTLAVTAHLRHVGGDSENVSVFFRAVDSETGFVRATARRNLSTVAGDREVTLTQPITVDREGGYRIEIITYQHGERVDETGRAVRGLGTLTPGYARTAVVFHRFDGGDDTLPSIQYSIADTGDERATLNVSTYLTNQGDEPSENLRVVLVARQAESGIVAARRTIRIGGIRPGRTATPAATLSVPDGYNYYLDAILWKDDVIVGSARSVANLDPTETIAANVTRRDVGLEVSDFEPDAERDRPDGTSGRGDAALDGRPRATGTPVSGPGFGVLAALVGLAAALMLARRQR
jgi:PGF-CTERM protein